MDQQVRRSRPGGRTERVRRAVLDAAIDELIDRGYELLSMSGIARRAGVDRTTLYRRWRTPGAIVAEAMLEARFEGPVPDTGSFAGDLQWLLTRTIPRFQTPRALALTRAVDAAIAVAELADARLRMFEWRRRVLVELLDRAVAREEFPPLPQGLVERVVDVVLGTLHCRLVVRGEQLSARDVDFVVDLATMIARASPPE